jgi:hypothetical protein
MPFRRLPSADVAYALITFDGRGVERTDDPEGGTFSRTVLDGIRRDRPTHIFLFSHGWKGDIPGAIDQYDRWIGAMWQLAADRAALGDAFRPFFIGLHWPSLPWGEESHARVSFDTGDGGHAVASLIDAAVEHFGGGDHLRAPLTVIFDAFAENPAARIVPDEVVAAYRQLGAAIGFSAGGDADAAPDHEGAPLDPQAAVRAERMANAGASFGIAGTFRTGILAGLRQASFWMMKHRARTVGEQGMHRFLGDVQRASDASLHLMGHSFGCIVASGILGGPGGTGSLPRAVESAALVQGALSLWSYADAIPATGTPGYFRHILAKRVVSGPLITTQSVNDAAVVYAFPAAVGLVNEFDFGVDLPKFGGIGAWGIQGTPLAETRTMLDDNGMYRLQPGRIYNVDGSRFIGDHNAVDGPQVAHLLWQAVIASRVQQA